MTNDRRMSLGTQLVAWASAILLSGGLVTSALAHGHEDEDADAPAKADEPAKEEAKGPNTGRVSFSITNDFTNVYFFRGIRQERNGFIWQPYFDVAFKLWESETAPVRGVTLGMGVWNSLHTRKTLSSGSGPSNLYETDFYPSLTLDLPGGFQTAFTYYVYTGPNGSFKTVQEFDAAVSYDDSELLGKWAMAPSVTFALETEKTSFGGKRGSWVGPKIEPTLLSLEGDKFSMAVTAPIEAGFAIDNYYEETGTPRHEKTFGYVSAGVTASVPISCIPSDFGSWSLSVTGRGFYLNNALARVNSNDRWYPQVVGSLGFSY